MKRKNSNMGILEALNGFLKQKELEGKSAPTIDNYRITVNKFVADTKTDVITQEVVDDWALSLIHSDLASATVSHYLRDLRTFINYLNLPISISIPKSQEDGIKFYSDEDISKLLTPIPKKSNYVDWRTYTSICLIMATGMRAGTLISIKVSDLDLKEGIVSFPHTKNRKAMNMPLSATIISVLNKYLNEWELEDYLFCDRCGNKLTVGALRQSIDKYCIRLGVEPKGTHALRHTFARMAIKNGMGAFQLQKCLGHCDISMTKKYVRLFDEDLRDSLKEYCPLDKVVKMGVKRKR